MISEAIGAGGQRVINAIVRGLGRSRINPNALTFIGLLIKINGPYTVLVVFNIRGDVYHKIVTAHITQ